MKKDTTDPTKYYLEGLGVRSALLTSKASTCERCPKGIVFSQTDTSLYSRGFSHKS